jgi:integrase
MARTVRNAKIDTRSGRAKLVVRSEPYWTVVSAGCAIGYRRGKIGGSWVARWRAKDGTQHYEKLGAADDTCPADDFTILSYAQVQERARAYFERKVREERGELQPSRGPYTVADAMRDYFRAQRRKGAKGADKDELSANARILPELGCLEVSRLSTQRLRRWHEDLAATPKLVRTGAHATQRRTKAIDEGDSDAVRSRRSTANRVLTILKAALNLAYHDGRVPSDDAWRKVKPFKAVDSAKVRYLSPDECRRLLRACPPDFARLARAALLTGCRYGELIRLKVSDVQLAIGTLHIGDSKSGKPRHVVLTAEGVEHFREVIADRPPSALVFLKSSGGPWKASQQARPIAVASKAAGIEPPATFHVLRHTHGSALAMAGAPMGVIARQLGHADTRITERHYAHLAPSYVADTIRASLPSFA